MKRHLFYFCMVFVSFAVSAQIASQDSLRSVLAQAPSGQSRLEVLVNLTDIAKGEDILIYGKALYAEALNAQNDYYKEAALFAILRQYVNTDQNDSAHVYLREVERELKGESRDCLLAYINMIMDTRIVYYTSSEEKTTIIKNNLVALETRKNLTPYQIISCNYTLGMAICDNLLKGLNIETSPRENKIKDTQFYFKSIVDVARKMQLRQAYYFLPNIYFMLCNLSTDPQERAYYASELLKLIQDYANQKEMIKRPHAINKRHLLNAYTYLATSGDAIGKERSAFYYQQFIDLLRAYPQAANVTPEYEYYSTSASYHFNAHDYETYIQFCDSLIGFYKTTVYEDQIISCVSGKIAAYDSLGMYKEAYDNFKVYTTLKDSANARNLRKELEGLEIQQSANSLIVEKHSLELDLQNAKKENYIFLSAFLLALGSVIYIFFRLYNMKTLYKELRESNQLILKANRKARESEEMKVAFIHNMSHEIRTPLNAINGFSELVADDSVSDEEKQVFNRIIHENCFHLTSMLDSLLEISQLDGTSDTFPLGPCPITEVCQYEIGQAKRFWNLPEVEYHLEGDPENDMIQTNRTYFSLVLSHLLANASKFTKKGHITIAYKLNNKSNEATLTVTDTGCGIPGDKLEWVFERFTKTNDFTQGSGLGLYLCRLILKRLNGHIKVDPEYTEGARLVITIPVSDLSPTE